MKIDGPQSLAAAVPYFLGFHPSESIVMICMSGPRGQMSPVLRLDIPRGSTAVRATSRFLTEQATRHATAVALVCYTEEANGQQRGRRVHPHDPLMQRCLAALRAAGIPVLDAILVRNGRAWSYLQHSPTDEGYVVPGADSPSVNHLQSVSVCSGRAVLADRAALADTISGPRGIAAVRAMEELEQAATRFAVQILDLDHRHTVRLGCEIAELRLDSCLAARHHARSLRSSAIADLIIVMADSMVRDSVISWALERIDAGLVPMFIDLARWTPDEAAMQICAALAVVAYRSGDGSLAQVALDRALAAEPTHRLAKVLVETLSSGIRPEELEALILDPADHPANLGGSCWPLPSAKSSDQEE